MVYSQLDWSAISLKRNSIQRVYEPVQIYFLTQLALRMEVRSFYDVGANIGSYSMAMAQLPSIERVHAFEPTPTLHVELAENARKNDRAAKITLHQVAISEETGSVDFAVINNYSGANGVAATLIHDSASIGRTITVPTSSLDDIIKTTGGLRDGPCVVKIDVEGHELAVLKGAGSLLQSHCVFQIEVYPSQIEDEMVQSFMRDHGYRCFWKIGADQYYMLQDMCPTESELLDVISRAHSGMIADFRAVGLPDEDPQETSIKRRFGPFEISLFDPFASLLRKTFKHDR
jgi:FkbM family methyltransferase